MDDPGRFVHPGPYGALRQYLAFFPPCHLRAPWHTWTVPPVLNMGWKNYVA